MIRAAGKTGLGIPMIFLGISGENVTRLVAGEPIVIHAADMAAMGLPAVEIVVHYGKTEKAVLDELRANGVALHNAEES